MNIDRMIEEAKHDHEQRHGFLDDGEDSAFESGFRHALRSLFPVVRVEDLEPNRFYWAYYEDCGGWHSVWGLHILEAGRKPTEIRVCPSPADLGLGVGE